MKKKLKEFTLGEISKICRKFDEAGCKECPFYEKVCWDLELFYPVKDLNKEIEINESQKRKDSDD